MTIFDVTRKQEKNDGETCSKRDFSKTVVGRKRMDELGLTFGWKYSLTSPNQIHDIL